MLRNHHLLGQVHQLRWIATGAVSMVEQLKSVCINFDHDARKSARHSSALCNHVKSSRSPLLLQELLSESHKINVFGVRELKTLKVVLTEEIDGLGRAGQVVGVAPGYARNKLIPHHLALPALDKYVTLVNNQLKFARPHLLVQKEDVKSTDAISEEEKLEEIVAALRRLDTGKVVLKRHVSSLNNLQQVVTKEDIIFEVKRQMGVELAASSVLLPADLTILGEFEVLLRFPRDLMMPGGKDKLHLKVRIRRK
ncbi:unnamed protein product [Calypogeia fissa]